MEWLGNDGLCTSEKVRQLENTVWESHKMGLNKIDLVLMYRKVSKVQHMCRAQRQLRAPFGASQVWSIEFKSCRLTVENKIGRVP